MQQNNNIFIFNSNNILDIIIIYINIIINNILGKWRKNTDIYDMYFKVIDLHILNEDPEFYSKTCLKKKKIII